jgi:cobalamin biosynthesis Mg chelatase CobN
MTSKTTLSSSVTNSTEKISMTEEPKITSGTHSSETTTRTTEETTSSTANTITSPTSRSPKSEDSDSLIYVIVGVVALVLIIGCVITSLIYWFLKSEEKDENLTKEERLLRAKQFIKDKKSETYRQKRLMKTKN